MFKKLTSKALKGEVSIKFYSVDFTGSTRLPYFDKIRIKIERGDKMYSSNWQPFTSSKKIYQINTSFQIPITVYYHSSDKQFLPKKMKIILQVQHQTSPPSPFAEQKVNLSSFLNKK